MSSERSRSVRSFLDEKFKPTFDQYDIETGIPTSDLKQFLGKSHLSESKVHKIVDSADKDGNQFITYNEFIEQVLSEDEKVIRRLRIHKRILNRAVLAIEPHCGREHQRAVVIDSGYDANVCSSSGANINNYIEAYDCRPPPIFIPLITIAEIAVFIYYFVTYRNKPDSNDFAHSSGFPIDSILIYNPTKRHELWRFLTYMFIHYGYNHLVFNCLVQIVLGLLLELVHKFWRVGLVYFLGVISGSLASSVTDSFSLVCGASGGCYALIGAHLATVIMNWDIMQEGWLKDPLSFISSGVVRSVIIIVLGGSDTALAIYDRFSNPNEKIRVGFSAHFGGFIAGLLLGVVILRNLKVEKWEKYFACNCVLIFLLFAVATILFNVYCYRINECPACDWDIQ
ncbi:unnamed protein product [Schistosoma rodhaini]|nr:unnamed protein product [Schistosoma rodhaini]